MATLQQYLQEKYPNRQEKKNVEKLDFSSLENIIKAELNFDGTDWESLREIKFGSRQLEGTLTISGRPNCPRLNTIDCSNNSLTKIDLSSYCGATYLGTGTLFKKLDFSNNKLTEIIWPSNMNKSSYLSVRKEINVSNNELPNLNFLNDLVPTEIVKLDVSGNKFSPSDLTPFANFAKLTCLRLDNNLFKGSLEPLKKLTELEELGVNDTNIDKGIEYLVDFEDLVRFYCFSSRVNSDRNKVWDLLRDLTSRTRREYSSLDPRFPQQSINTNFASYLFQLRIKKLEEQVKLERKQKQLELGQERKKKTNEKDTEKIKQLTEENEILKEENIKLTSEIKQLKWDKISLRETITSIRELTDSVVESDYNSSEETETVAQVEVPPKF